MKRAYPLLVGVVAACGARTGLDVSDGADAAKMVDAARDSTLPTDAGADVDVGDVVVIDQVAPPLSVSCDAGYYIKVADEAGTTLLHHAFNQAGVPSETIVPGMGEDCWVWGIAGDDDGVNQLALGVAACTSPQLAIGSVKAQGSHSNALGHWFGFGTMDVGSITDAAVTGDYTVTFTLNANDAGKPITNGPTQDVHGTFCVLPPE